MNRILDGLHKVVGTHTPLKTLPSQEAYTLWAAHYPPMPHNALMEIEQEAMLSLLPDLHGKRVLDLACGSGRYGVVAKTLGAVHVAGFDNSLPMLREASLPVGQAEMDAIPAADSAFDIVLCGMATGHLPRERMRQTVREMARVVKPGGLVLISDFHPYQTLSGHQRTFTGSDGKPYAVEHYLHLVTDYFDAFSAFGLRLTGLAEPCATGQTAPAVLVLRGERT